MTTSGMKGCPTAPKVSEGGTRHTECRERRHVPASLHAPLLRFCMSVISDLEFYCQNFNRSVRVLSDRWSRPWLAAFILEFGIHADCGRRSDESTALILTTYLGSACRGYTRLYVLQRTEFGADGGKERRHQHPRAHVPVPSGFLRLISALSCSSHCCEAYKAATRPA